jgi:hypothetical protein
VWPARQLLASSLATLFRVDDTFLLSDTINRCNKAEGVHKDVLKARRGCLAKRAMPVRVNRVHTELSSVQAMTMDTE